MTNGSLWNNSSMIEGFGKAQDISSTMSSTASSTSPDGSFMNFLRQDSHNANSLCPSPPISPENRQRSGLIPHNRSCSDDSQGFGGVSASPAIQQNRFSPGGTPNNFAIDGRTSRTYSGDSLLSAPPNLDVDSLRTLDAPYLTTPTKPGLPIIGGNAVNRDRSYSSPSTNLRQLPIGARSPLQTSNQTLFENKVSSSWNDGPAFPSPNVHRSDSISTPGAPGDRFSSRPPRYGVNREVSPRADNFNFSSQTSYFNQTNPMQNQNHMRSQSLGVGFGGPQAFDTFHGGTSNNHDNLLNRGGMNEVDNNALQVPLELGGLQFLNLNQDGPGSKQDNMHSRSPSLPPGFMNNSQDLWHNFHTQQGLYHSQNPQMPSLQRHNSTGTQHFVVNERGEIVGHATPVMHQGSIGGYVQGVNSYSGTKNFHVLPQHPAFNNDGGQRQTMPQINRNLSGDKMLHQRSNTEPNLLHNSDVNDDLDQALVGENIEDVEEVDVESRSSSRGGVVEENNFSYASTLMKAPPDATVNLKSSQLYTAGAALTKARPKLVYNIKFKRSQRNFILSERITRDIKVGTYVKVEADRGEDLGIVYGVVPVEKFRPKQSSVEGDESSQANNISGLKRVMRVATNDEISLLEVKNQEEEELLKICRTKAHQRGLPMTVVDAEYQFDRHKLTFFFEAEGRIDFRELVRDLFSMYKTRIWMQQLDKSGAIKED